MLAARRGLLVVSLILTDVPVREPLALVAAMLALLVLFCTLGVVVGVYVNNLVILPLSFLGGVFYSVDRLPSPWFWLALGVTLAFAAVFVAWSHWLFATGRRLKP